MTPAAIRTIVIQSVRDGHSPSAGMAISAAMIGPSAMKTAALEAPKMLIARP
jgi:hypothetical protein